MRLSSMCVGLLLAAGFSQASAMTLTEAIQSTIDNHPEIHAGSNNRLDADERLKIAKGGYLPTVDVIASYGREHTDSPTTRASDPLRDHNTETLNKRTAELRLRQMVFDGLYTPNEIARNEAVVNARAYRLLGNAESLALRSVEVYLEVLKSREMVALAENNLRAHRRIHDQITLRAERGVGSAADRDQSQARLALAENNLYTEQVNLADAEANFFSVVGRMPDQLEMPASLSSLMPDSVHSAREQVMTNNPLLKSAQSDVQAAEKQYEAAKSKFYPRFDVELSTNADENLSGSEGHNSRWYAGVVMNYNLFNGMRDKALLQSGAHQINESMDIRNNALRVLNENLMLSWNAMENARLQTPKARDYADYTARVREAYQQQFSLGQRSLLDLLDSENELFTANRRYTQIRYTEEFSMYRVVTATGELLRKHNIVPPAEAIALSEVTSEARLPNLK